MNLLFIVMGVLVILVLGAAIAAKEAGVFLRIVVNAILGIVAIAAVNRFLPDYGLYIGTNPFTVGMISIFGLPGFFSVALLSYLL